MNAEIPDKVVGFNVYTQGTRLGTTGKVDTPEFKMKTSTMSGAGIGGDVDSPTPGQWEATEHEIPLTLLGKDLALLLQQGRDVQLIYRGATQVALKSGGAAMKQLRVVEGGMVKGFQRRLSGSGCSDGGKRHHRDGPLQDGVWCRRADRCGQTQRRLPRERKRYAGGT